jgi:hypothetical protein
MNTPGKWAITVNPSSNTRTNLILTNIGVPDTFPQKLMGGLVTAISSFIAGMHSRDKENA